MEDELGRTQRCFENRWPGESWVAFESSGFRYGECRASGLLARLLSGVHRKVSSSTLALSANLNYRAALVYGSAMDTPAATVDPTPRINLVSLVKRTLAKVLVTAGVEESAPSYRIVASVLVNIAAEYVKVLGDEPKHIEALFHIFLTGTEDEQREAIRIFGESLAAADLLKAPVEKPIEPIEPMVTL